MPSLRPIRLPTEGARMGTLIKARGAARDSAMRLEGFRALGAGLRGGFRERTRKAEREEEFDYRKTQDAQQYGLAQQRLSLTRSQIVTRNFADAANMSFTQFQIADQKLADAQNRATGPDDPNLLAARQARDSAQGRYNDDLERARGAAARVQDFSQSVNSAVGCKPGGT